MARELLTEGAIRSELTRLLRARTGENAAVVDAGLCVQFGVGALDDWNLTASFRGRIRALRGPNMARQLDLATFSLGYLERFAAELSGPVPSHLAPRPVCAGLTVGYRPGEFGARCRSKVETYRAHVEALQRQSASNLAQQQQRPVTVRRPLGDWA